jgi:hypothetical protein
MPKRINTRTKGANAEREAQGLLHASGYLVDRVKGSSKFNKQVDFFGIGDLNCIPKKTMEDQSFLIVQVKSNTTAGAPKKIRLWRSEFEIPSWVKTQVWVRYDNKDTDNRWRVIDVV